MRGLDAEKIKEEGISHRAIVIYAHLFMLTSLLVLERVVGHCREFKRKEFLNQGVLKFNAAFMNILFSFHMSESMSLIKRKM